jgi:hypothetical protein
MVRTLNQHSKSLHNKIEMAEECQDVDTEWQQIRDSVLNVVIR